MNSGIEIILNEPLDEKIQTLQQKILSNITETIKHLCLLKILIDSEEHFSKDFIEKISPYFLEKNKFLEPRNDLEKNYVIEINRLVDNIKEKNLENEILMIFLEIRLLLILLDMSRNWLEMNKFLSEKINNYLFCLNVFNSSFITTTYQLLSFFASNDQLNPLTKFNLTNMLFYFNEYLEKTTHSDFINQEIEELNLKNLLLFYFSLPVNHDSIPKEPKNLFKKIIKENIITELTGKIINADNPLKKELENKEDLISLLNLLCKLEEESINLQKILDENDKINLEKVLNFILKQDNTDKTQASLEKPLIDLIIQKNKVYLLAAAYETFDEKQEFMSLLSKENAEFSDNFKKLLENPNELSNEKLESMGILVIPKIDKTYKNNSESKKEENQKKHLLFSSSLIQNSINDENINKLNIKENIEVLFENSVNLLNNIIKNSEIKESLHPSEYAFLLDNLENKYNIFKEHMDDRIMNAPKNALKFEAFRSSDHILSLFVILFIHEYNKKIEDPKYSIFINVINHQNKKIKRDSKEKIALKIIEIFPYLSDSSKKKFICELKENDSIEKILGNIDSKVKNKFFKKIKYYEKNSNDFKDEKYGELLYLFGENSNHENKKHYLDPINLDPIKKSPEYLNYFNYVNPGEQDIKKNSRLWNIQYKLFSDTRNESICFGMHNYHLLASMLDILFLEAKEGSTEAVTILEKMIIMPKDSRNMRDKLNRAILHIAFHMPKIKKQEYLKNILENYQEHTIPWECQKKLRETAKDAGFLTKKKAASYRELELLYEAIAENLEQPKKNIPLSPWHKILEFEGWDKFNEALNLICKDADGSVNENAKNHMLQQLRQYDLELTFTNKRDQKNLTGCLIASESHLLNKGWQDVFARLFPEQGSILKSIREANLQITIETDFIEINEDKQRNVY